MPETLKQMLTKATPDYETMSLSDSTIIETIRQYFEARKADLGKRPISAIHKMYLESEYDTLILELI